MASPLGPIYPAAGTNDPMDAYVLNGRGTWDDIVVNGTTATGESASDANFYITVNSNVGESWECGRGLVIFDTSPIPAGAIPTLATLELKMNTTVAKSDDGTTDVVLVGITPTSDSNVTDTDFGEFGIVLFSDRIALSTLSNNNYATWTLTQAGLDAIGKGTGGRTKLGIMIGTDFDKIDPATASYSDYVTFDSADTGGTSSDPKLTVEYTEVSPSLSPSVSPSLSPSVSPSASLSPSISPSLSPSVSPSVSPSPSPAGEFFGVFN